MKNKGVLLDLDNTLYDYSKSHKAGLKSILDYCENNFDISKSEALSAFNYGRHKVHIELIETASSHNRLLYIQKMLESINVSPFKHALNLYNLYWDHFINEMVLFDGVINFLEKYNQKICIVSDLTAHIQYRKIKKLNIGKYINCIVTSEEAGKEKPHAYPFMLALQKLKLTNKEVFMVGDSFAKDIVGALNMEIKSYWINSDQNTHDYDPNLVTEIKLFNEILKYT
jgi:FMN phosphatase YigB (HAD superfamily)|tara:strand:- start:15 stop:695 length:681 start_codon:yes stop_codon:yes gene_type:complete